MAISRRHFREHITEEHRKCMLRVFGTVEEIRRTDEKAGWNYVNNEIESYRSGDNVEARELADDIEMFVHASYSVEM